MQISTAMQKVVEEVATYHHTFVDLIFALHFRWMSEERLIQLGH